MGGYSSEHDISIKTGEAVCKTLQNKYDVFPIHILKEKWVHIDADNIETPIDKSDFSVTLGNKKITFDVVFNAIHGHPGEDGVFIAYLELLGLPHTSDTSYKMGLTFNKRDCLSSLDPYGVPHAKSVYLNKGEKIDLNAIVEHVGLPCFVKANRAGSSYGVTKAIEKSDIIPALETAFKEDNEVLIEEFLDGTEVSVGVITYNNEVLVLPITEIVSENDFFDFEAKYQGKSQEITPARLSNEQEGNVKQLAKKVYQSLQLRGLSRAEYIFKNGVPHFIEINTIPGITNESILPQQAAVAGISLEALLTSVVENALNQIN